MLRRITLFVPTLLLLSAVPATAQPLAPPTPEKYEVQIRYQIEAKRNERVTQYFEMLRDLKKIGFHRDPNEDVPDNEPENPKANRLSGTIAADKVPLLLKQRHVRTVRLKAVDAKLPGNEELVRVHLDLVAGLPLEPQRTLYKQARDVLAALKFEEGTGYDHRRYSRIVGAIPVKNLDALLLDFRRQPQAWKLLSKTLLTDLRSSPGGQQVLEDIVTDWYADKAGKKIVTDSLALWRLSPSARALMQTLPADVAGDPDSPIVQERLLIDLLRSPDAEQALARMLANVYVDAAAPELVGRMLGRIETQIGGGGLPVIFRGLTTTRVVEVHPELPLPKVRPIPQPLPPELEKLTPDLRELVGDPARAALPVRLELIYAVTPAAATLRPLGGLDVLVEGQVGPVVTVQTTLANVKALAALDAIASIRLPRLPQSLPLVPPSQPKPLPLREMGVARLHAMGHRGKGIVVAVLDPDFRGWDAMVKDKKLPRQTRLLDLTRERNNRMDADPWPGDPQQVGVGTRYALTLAAVAPEVELFLVRVDPAAPYMVQNVARAINGEGYHSPGMEQRFEALKLERSVLDLRKEQLLKERREAYSDNVEITEEDKKRSKYQQMLKEKRADVEILEWLQETKREEYRQRQKAYDKDEADYKARIKLYLQLQGEYNELKRVRVAVSSLVWNEGYPVDGSSPLSRYFDDRPFKAAIWFQAGGDARNQAWTGLFRDDDANGVMEFAAPNTPLQKGQWSHEYNFVKWQPADGPEALDLPADVRIRLTLQWREPHDPDYWHMGEDRYREPLANLKLVLVQQLDPGSTSQPSDDLQVIAESVGPPQRLYALPNSATYEQTLEVRVPKAGRYAVRIEGQLPTGIEPRGAPTLPTARRFGELKPRLFVQTLAAPGPGRVVLHTYWTDAGTLGMPVDAHQVVAVAPINDKRERQPYGSRGPAHGMDLLVKPDLLASDEADGLVHGSGEAAAVAAGVAAITMNGNAPVRNWMKGLGLQPGDVIRVPETWPR